MVAEFRFAFTRMIENGEIMLSSCQVIRFSRVTSLTLVIPSVLVQLDNQTT